jgi:hypothetical protein
MRTTILLCACLLALTSPAQLTGKKHSFYVQGGYRSSLFIKEAQKHGLNSETESSHHKCIVMNAGFHFYLRDSWRIGAAFTYDHFGTKHRSVEFSNLSYMLRCDKVWWKKNKYSLYSGLATGLTKTRMFENEREILRELRLGYHIYPLGVEYEILKNLFIDANAGWGVSGIASAGARFHF